MDDYFTKRTSATTALHSLMRATFQFRRRNAAISTFTKPSKRILAAGKFFYGTVTLEDVVKVLDANVTSGALRFKIAIDLI